MAVWPLEEAAAGLTLGSATFRRRHIANGDAEGPATDEPGAEAGIFGGRSVGSIEPPMWLAEACFGPAC